MQWTCLLKLTILESIIQYIILVLTISIVVFCYYYYCMQIFLMHDVIELSSLRLLTEMIHS